VTVGGRRSLPTMASKKSKVAAPAVDTPPPVESVPPKSSTLAELLALTAQQPVTAESSPTVEGCDPAIQGATQNKNTVTLGLDPKFTRTAARAAKLNAVLKSAAEMFANIQVELRAYGKAKRDAYNELWLRDITTVNIPYYVKVPKDDPESETPGRRLEHVQVICTSRYSVIKDTVLRLERELGDAFQKLFVKAEQKVLKRNVEPLVKQILKEVGVPEERIAPTMAVLFETQVSVSARPDYETEHKKLPEKTRLILDQAVVRQQPSLRFPEQ
jgi:hypothetical protein